MTCFPNLPLLIPLISLLMTFYSGVAFDFWFCLLVIYVAACCTYTIFKLHVYIGFTGRTTQTRRKSMKILCIQLSIVNQIISMSILMKGV